MLVMMNKRNPGHLVELPDGKQGRTYNNQDPINGKIPVYIATEYEEDDDIKVAVKFDKEGRLFKPEDLKVIGLIG